MMILRWLISSTVRDAVALRRHVAKLLAAQTDLLKPEAIAALQAAMDRLQRVVEQGADKGTLVAEMKTLETAGNELLHPTPYQVWRENIEVLLVAIAVAMAIRTFFLQPFKIPTGSMQPTLYGVTPDIGSGNQADLVIPGMVRRQFDYWFSGYSYFHEIAPEDGVLERVYPPQRFLLFNLRQDYVFNGRRRTIWFPADELFQRAGICPRDNWSVMQEQYRRGDDIIRLRVVAGDHLFVNRLSYNFTHPKRGDIVVFATKGFDPAVAYANGLRSPVNPDQYYIKRLVGLSGDRVQIGSDQHLVVNGERLDAATPYFESVYTFSPNAGPNDYFGHTFRDASQTYPVQEKHCLVMGDNTRNSLDGRYLGDFSQENIIGKANFIYWPILSPGKRFGFGYR
jgi:signal peptidase I